MSKFSSQHYKKVAGILKSTKEIAEVNIPTDVLNLSTEGAVRLTAIKFAQLFQEDNPRFNRNKFMEACGYE